MSQLPGDSRLNQYTATASQTTFIYSFTIRNTDELVVQQNSTTLTLTTHYTVTGAGTVGGGTIVLVTGATLNDVITITGSAMVERETTFTNGGDFSADAVNGEFDNLLSMISENVTTLAKSLHLETYSSTFDPAIPTPVATKVIKVNAAGTGFEMSTYNPDTQVAAASASAAAALVSQNAASSSASTASAAAVAAAASAASVDYSAVAANIIPSDTATYSLGSTGTRWLNVWGGNAAFSGTVESTGNLTVNTNKLVVTAASGNTAIAGTLGAVGDFAVNTNKFNVTATSGNTAVAGTLNSVGNFTVNTNKMVVTAASGNTTIAGTLDVTGALTASNLHKGFLINYTVAEGTHGGTLTAGDWRTRPLNASFAWNTIGAAVDTNVLTIPAGTYIGHLMFVCYEVNDVDWRIYDSVGAGSVKAYGNGSAASELLADNYVTSTPVYFVGAAEMTIVVQNWSQSTKADTGMGLGGAVTSGNLEEYLALLLYKVA